MLDIPKLICACASVRVCVRVCVYAQILDTTRSVEIYGVLHTVCVCLCVSLVHRCSTLQVV